MANRGTFYSGFDHIVLLTKFSPKISFTVSSLVSRTIRVIKSPARIIVPPCGMYTMPSLRSRDTKFTPWGRRKSATLFPMAGLLSPYLDLLKFDLRHFSESHAISNKLGMLFTHQPHFIGP